MTMAVGARLRPAALLQLSLLVSVTCSLGRIPLFSVGLASAPLLISDLAVGLVLVGACVVGLQAGSARLDNVAVAALLFAAVGGVSAVAAIPRFGLSAFETFVSLAYLARWMFYFGLYLTVINWITRRDVEGVWRALEWMLIVFAAFGIVQSIFLPGFAQMVYPDSRLYLDWDPQGNRLVSTALEPNIAAAMILMGLLVQLGRMSVGVKTTLWKPMILLVAMAMTLSRSGGLGLLFGGMVILAVRGLSPRLVKFAAVITVAIVISLPKLIPFAEQYGKFSLGGSAAGRLINLGLALQAFVEHPIIGVGFNTFGFYQERMGYERLGLAFQSSDGGLLFAAVMTGTLGLAVFVVMLVMVFRRCRRVWSNRVDFTAEERGLCVGVAAGVIGLNVHSLFVNSLFATPVLQPVWVLWGLTYVIEASVARAERRPEAAHRVVSFAHA